MSIFKKLKNNYYLVFIYRLCVVMFLFQLCRFIFYFLNFSMFPGIGWKEWMNILKGGFAFDTAAMFYFNALFILFMLIPFRFRESIAWQRVVKYIFIITNGIALLLNSIDFIYYRFTLRRTTRSVFNEFSNEINKSKLLGQFLIDYWYVVVIFAGLIILMIWLYNRVKVYNTAIRVNSRAFYIKAIAVLLLTTVLAVGGIRGDFKHSTRPITISNAGEYVTRPDEMYLVLNTPFSLVRTWNVNQLKEVSYYTDAKAEKIYSPLHKGNTKKDAALRKDNVVIILLESFSKEMVGGYNKDLDAGNYKGYTPFIDSLMSVSKVFWNSFANGRKSIDALPSVLAGIPGGMDPFVLTPYASDSIHSLPYILDQEGYNTSFFHGAPNGSMGFKALVNLLGVQHYYGKTEYNNDEDFDGMWGIWDEPFFQFFANTLSTFKQPFFSTIFSVSSHHPFKVPPQYAGKFKKGPLPVMECIGYTDMALRKFFEKASHTDWYKNTLFIISADHSTEAYHPNYQNAWGDIAIPILLYHPGDSTLRGVDSSGVIQQIDVMPSILSYLNYNKPFFAFGENVFDPQRLNFSVYYNSGYRWIENNFLLYFDGKKSKSLFDYKKDKLLENNLIDSEPQIAERMERHLKAFIQQYNNRLIRNQLINKNDG
ncbi:MAG: sulfatase-like hydrolase/transferase [Bacteroidetes bacterium]|nr:sulfatase-like hydrolase/transferase [Bacteroidota bacterium]